MPALPRKQKSLLEREQWRMLYESSSNSQRQQDEEVRAIYISSPYRLSDRYKKLELDSVKCIQ